MKEEAISTVIHGNIFTMGQKLRQTARNFYKFANLFIENRATKEFSADRNYF
jgi:hypothetical protein